MATMLLDLSEIVIREGMRSQVAVDQAGVEDPDLAFATPLSGRLTFENGGDLINIRGRLGTSLRLGCSRCLAELSWPLDLRVEEHFPIENVLHPDRPPAPGDDEFDTTISSVVHLNQGRPILDLDELLRQLILSEIPIRTLCREGCLGLCPTCGVNRNVTPCSCREEPHNTPLAGLSALLEPGDGAG